MISLYNIRPHDKPHQLPANTICYLKISIRTDVNRSTNPEGLCAQMYMSVYMYILKVLLYKMFALHIVPSHTTPRLQMHTLHIQRVSPN